jgi:hypothetical protein
MSDRFYLKQNLRLTQLLVDWEPTDADKPFKEEVWIRTRGELAYSLGLESDSIETRGSGDAVEFCLSNENLTVWVGIFAEVLNVLEDRVEALISTQPTEDAEGEVLYLHGALYGLIKVFENHPEIFDQTSLTKTLLDGFKTPPDIIAHSLDSDDEEDSDDTGIAPASSIPSASDANRQFYS